MIAAGVCFFWAAVNLAVMAFALALDNTTNAVIAFLAAMVCGVCGGVCGGMSA